MNYISQYTIAFVMMFIMIIKGQDMKNELQVVNKVDLNNYIGLWYEVAKIPNWFQKKCIKNTTAEYSLQDDGNIKVVNSCIQADGSKNVAEGIAKVVDKINNAKLEVSFVRILGIQLFWGDYWIIGLGDNYEYAIVGTPDRKYGWILSRTQELSQEKLSRITDLLKIKGYDINNFEFTEQN